MATPPILLASVVFRIVIPVLIAIKLCWRFRHLGMLERIGLALAGGGSLLTVPPMLFTHTTPYTNWAGLIFGLGFSLYLLGKLIKEYRS